MSAPIIFQFIYFLLLFISLSLKVSQLSSYLIERVFQLSSFFFYYFSYLYIYHVNVAVVLCCNFCNFMLNFMLVNFYLFLYNIKFCFYFIISSIRYQHYLSCILFCGFIIFHIFFLFITFFNIYSSLFC